MAYGKPLGRKGALVVAAVIGGSAAMVGGLLWAGYLALSYEPSAGQRWGTETVCEPRTSPGYHGYIMRCVTPSGRVTETRDVEWERQTGVRGGASRN
jgi:hypothetical protein